jgi:hypothetical protein
MGAPEFESLVGLNIALWENYTAKLLTSCAKLLDMDDMYRDSYGHLVTITLTRVDLFYHLVKISIVIRFPKINTAFLWRPFLK